MGRGAITAAPVDVAIVQASFTVRQDGRLIHSPLARSDYAGRPAGFTLNGVPMVRLTVAGKVRRLAVLRVGSILAHGAAARGVVKPKDGDPWHANPANLILVPHAAHKPHLKGGPSTSLVRRQEADRAVLAAMVDHPGAAVEQLGKIVGTTEARTSARLVRLAAQGLTRMADVLPRSRLDAHRPGPRRRQGRQAVARSPGPKHPGGARRMLDRGPTAGEASRLLRSYGAPEACPPGEERLGLLGSQRGL